MQSCYEFAHLKPVTAFPPSARNHQHRIRLSQNAIKIPNLRVCVCVRMQTFPHVLQSMYLSVLCLNMYAQVRT